MSAGSFSCNVCACKNTTWKHFIMSLIVSWWTSSLCWNGSDFLVLCLGVKPYACTMCDMRFIQRYQLERHSLTHTGTSSVSLSWPSLSLTSVKHALHVNVYMAASNSSLCFLSLYLQVLMFHVSSARSFLSTSAHTLYMKWHDDREAKCPILLFWFAGFIQMFGLKLSISRF